MRYSPHEYQKYVIEYIKKNPVAAVFLDMGLGKTSITLTTLNDLLFDSFDVHRILVVAPLRVARNTWSSEIEKWEHLQDLQYSIVVGTEKERMNALEKRADIYIINRENVQWLVEKSGKKFDYDMVVVDELSSFKNHEAKRFRAFMKVRPKVKRIVGLTGLLKAPRKQFSRNTNLMYRHVWMRLSRHTARIMTGLVHFWMSAVNWTVLIPRNPGISILHTVPIAQDAESMPEVPQIFILPLILSGLPERRRKKACSLRA